MVPEEERYFGKEVSDMKLSLPKSNLPSKLHPYLQDVIAELVSMSVSSANTVALLFVRDSLCTIVDHGVDYAVSTSPVLVALSNRHQECQ